MSTGRKLLTDFAQLVTVDPARMTPENPLGVIPNGAMAIEGERIAWVGPMDAIPPDWTAEVRFSQRGRTGFPGFIDSHTHMIFAGNRADEFEQRLRGATYPEIAARGGGIQKTVAATRAAGFDELYTLAHARLLESMRFGITTLEAKSGYGLTMDSEIQSLAVLDALKQDLPLDIRPTFMGAHDIPPEFKGRTEEYVDLVCQEMIPHVADRQLAEFCDVFCETGYFSVTQSRRILEAGLDHGLRPRIHAEEFSDLGGAAMAAEIGALSADHLLHLSDAGVAALADSTTVATLLPGTAFYLKLDRYAPARKLWDGGATVALATDFNPGSCMSQNLQLVMALACMQMDLLPHEAIRAVTLNAAHALGLAHDRGSLTPGKRADLAIFALPDYHGLLYHFGMNTLVELWIAGENALICETELGDTDPGEDDFGFGASIELN